MWNQMRKEHNLRVHARVILGAFEDIGAYLISLLIYT